MVDYPFKAPALRVRQPIGIFYVTVLPAELLLQVASSDVMSASLNPNGVGYSLAGTQRLIQDKRLSQIADYIDRIDSAFPNSIILAANYNKDVGFDQEELEDIELEDREDSRDGQQAPIGDASKSWSIVEEKSGHYQLVIPSSEKLAAIIDGQHRLFAFTRADARSRLPMELLCSIFLDLPKPFQAQLFATINSTQKRVDRSLTFELFGYNVSDEPEELWSPDKLAVFLTRKLSTEERSPLRGRITVSPKRDAAIQAIMSRADWRVSTAVVVDGILRLFSTNPKRDANAMRTPEACPRSALMDGPRDRSPLRDAFIAGNDSLIYTLAEHFLIACSNLFWNTAHEESYIVKTVGVQALFDILRKHAAQAYAAKDLRVAFFEEILRPAARIDFAATEFRVPAGSGRSAIRRAIEEAIER